MMSWIAFSNAPARGGDERPPVIEHLQAGSLLGDASTSLWTIVSATSIVTPTTPEGDLIDFAHLGNPLLDRATVSANPVEGVSSEAPLWDGTPFTDSEGGPIPAFWTAPTPATYTVLLKRPIELRYVDLLPPSRKHAFADFTVQVRKEARARWRNVNITDATVSAGPTLGAGFYWRLAIAPEPVVEVAIQFHRGSLYLSRQIFLQDLDLWGKQMEEAGSGEPISP